jgi:hypothetical protein
MCFLTEQITSILMGPTMGSEADVEGSECPAFVDCLNFKSNFICIQPMCSKIPHHG